MPIHRPDIGETEGLEQHARREEGLEAPLAAHGVERKFLSDTRDAAQKAQYLAACLAHPAARQRAAQKERERADIGRDGHFVVVENHDEPAPHVPGKVQAFKGLPGREGAVADHRDDMVVLAGQITRLGHAQSRGNGGGGMTDPEMVVGAFLAPRKTGNAPQAAQAVKNGGAAREQLVGIGLMPHIPDKFVPVEVKFRQQRQGQFHHAQ